MKTYIGTKAVIATPMTRKQYNDYRGWELPTDEDGTDTGYLVEYTDGGQANHPDHIGYISWSPEVVFNNSYKASGEMSMGMAITAMKQGKRVQRAGWNGKDMFLYYVPANTYTAQTTAARESIGEYVRYTAYIAMKTVTGEVVPWLASQTDLLADDWSIL